MKPIHLQLYLPKKFTLICWPLNDLQNDFTVCVPLARHLQSLTVLVVGEPYINKFFNENFFINKPLTFASPSQPTGIWISSLALLNLAKFHPPLFYPLIPSTAFCPINRRVPLWSLSNSSHTIPTAVQVGLFLRIPLTMQSLSGPIQRTLKFTAFFSSHNLFITNSDSQPDQTNFSQNAQPKRSLLKN